MSRALNNVRILHVENSITIYPSGLKSCVWITCCMWNVTHMLLSQTWGPMRFDWFTVCQDESKNQKAQVCWMRCFVMTLVAVMLLGRDVACFTVRDSRASRLHTDDNQENNWSVSCRGGASVMFGWTPDMVIAQHALRNCSWKRFIPTYSGTICSHATVRVYPVITVSPPSHLKP